MEENKQHQKSENDEIDLSFLFQKIGDFFKNLLIGFLRIIAFYYKKKWILLALVVAGGILGYFWEKKATEKFKNNFIVEANYGSADYLYNKIEAIDSKIELKDSAFLRKTFGEHHLKVKSIEIEPIVNIYSFISRSESNRELFELLSDDVADVPEFIKEPVNSRNYPKHIINLIVEAENENMHQAVSDRFFSYLNNNEYFNNAKEISLENTTQQIDQNKEIRQQIDAIISSIVNQDVLDGKNPIVSIKQDQMVDDLLDRKGKTLNDDEYLKTQLENKNKVIQVVDTNYQIEFEESILSKDKMFLLPFIFIILFSLAYLFKYLFRSSSSFLAQQNK